MSSIVIKLASPLRRFANGAAELHVDAATVREALGSLALRYPDLVKNLLDGSEPRHFVGLYAGTQNIKAGRGLDTELRDGDVLNVIVAVAGG